MNARQKSVWFDAAARIVTASEYHKSSSRRQLAIDPFACVALSLAGASGKQADAFGDWFYPIDRKRYSASWWRSPFDTDADQEARRLALCFMHWIERTEK